MEEVGSTSPGFRLDLNNFDSVGAERSRYVLTSPRSLQSCARLGIKPVDLLIKSLNQLMAEQRDVPVETVSVIHASYEKERRRLLQICREERERIIREAGASWQGRDRKVLGLQGLVPGSKLEHGSKEILYADLCFKEKSVSKLSCSTAGRPARNPDRSRSTACSLRLGDLSHSPATEMKLERLTEDIEKKLCVTVSETDCKIAALMLAKHQQERESMRLCQRQEQERQEARGQEEARRAQAEKERRKTLMQSMQRWHEMLGARRRLRQRWEEERVRHLEQEALLQSDRWRRLKEGIEARRREKMESAQREAGGRKRCQEELLRQQEELEKRRREMERQVASEREQKAMRRSKVMRERKKGRWLEEVSRQELLRRVLLRQRAVQQEEEEEAQMRSMIERKLQQSCEKRAQAAEARLRELQVRSVREEEQIQRARLRAELQDVQQLRHRRILALLGQRRMQRAALHVSAQRRARAQQTRERNRHRLLCHQTLRERLQREEEAARKVRETCVSAKERRRERLRRQREQVQEEARRRARASSHMRERVRQQTQRRTFDRMALEAQLIASMSLMKV